MQTGVIAGICVMVSRLYQLCLPALHLIEPPEYHGNPISSEGSLVTVNWGYDITTFIFESSGLFTEIVFLDILEYGIRAEYIEVLIAWKFPRKNSRELKALSPRQ
jgi:hypothetical protein